MMAEPEIPHFLKNMTPELLSSGKLDFSEAYTRKYGKDLLDWVLLQVPNGETWTVDLEKDRERVRFGRGWRNFVDYYSILPKYSVVFGLEGNSMFHAVILDEIVVEIEYLMASNVAAAAITNMAKPRE